MHAGQERQLSREVLGPVAEAGTGPRDDPARGATRIPELDDVTDLDHDPDLVTDLGAPLAPTPAVRRPGADRGHGATPRRPDLTALLRWPASTPSWVRTPVALVAVALVGAVVGGLVAAGAGERRELREDQSTVRLLSAISAPAFRSLGVNGELPVRVVVLNAGPEPVTVTGARLEGTDTALALDGARVVQPGRSGSLDAIALLDCSGGAPGDLLLTVEAADGSTTEIAAPDLGRGVGILPAELNGYCSVTEQPLPVFATEIAEDGRLEITLRNDRDRVVQLTAESPNGTSLLGEPALPLALERGETVVLRLAVQVDRCTFAALRADAGGQVELAVDDARAQAPIDSLTAAGWFAQQLARACPDGPADQ